MGTQILCHDFQWKIRNLFSEQQTVDTNFTVYDAGQLPVSLEEGREGWGRDDVYRRKQQHNPSHLDGAWRCKKHIAEIRRKACDIKGSQSQQFIHTLVRAIELFLLLLTEGKFRCWWQDGTFSEGLHQPWHKSTRNSTLRNWRRCLGKLWLFETENRASLSLYQGQGV